MLSHNFFFFREQHDEMLNKLVEQDPPEEDLEDVLKQMKETEFTGISSGIIVRNFIFQKENRRFIIIFI